MLPALLIAAIPLIGSMSNGLECSFTTRCTSGVCMNVDASSMRLIFVMTPGGKEPAIFVLGHERLFDGQEITDKEAPSMTRSFGEFGYTPRTFAYAVGDMNGYEPATGAVALEVGGRQLTVAADGKATLEPLREGVPGVSWLTRYSGQCVARNF